MLLVFIFYWILCSNELFWESECFQEDKKYGIKTDTAVVLLPSLCPNYSETGEQRSRSQLPGCSSVGKQAGLWLSQPEPLSSKGNSFNVYFFLRVQIYISAPSSGLHCSSFMAVLLRELRLGSIYASIWDAEVQVTIKGKTATSSHFHRILPLQDSCLSLHCKPLRMYRLPSW